MKNFCKKHRQTCGRLCAAFGTVATLAVGYVAWDIYQLVQTFADPVHVPGIRSCGGSPTYQELIHWERDMETGDVTELVDSFHFGAFRQDVPVHPRACKHSFVRRQYEQDQVCIWDYEPVVRRPTSLTVKPERAPDRCVPWDEFEPERFEHHTKTRDDVAERYTKFLNSHGGTLFMERPIP